MRHVLSLAAIAAFCAFTAPAFAAPADVTQEQIDAGNAAVEAADLSDDAYQNMWCGAAFGIVKELSTASGDTATADQMNTMQEAVFAKAATELQAAGVSQEDFGALAENFYYVAVGQTKANDGSADFTQEECTAAAQP